MLRGKFACHTVVDHSTALNFVEEQSIRNHHVFCLCTTSSCQHSPQGLQEIISSQPLTHAATTHIIHTPIHQHHLPGQYLTCASPIPYKTDLTTPSDPQIKSSTSSSSTKVNSTHSNSTPPKELETKLHNVHPPYLPLATLPPPTLHQHRHLLVRRSTPGFESF